MGKDKQNQDKIGQANRNAWEAAHKTAKAMRKEHKEESWRKLPWREIREQLRRNGDVVDMTAVPVSWTSESPQVMKMHDILQEAGFIQDGHLYIWKEDT
jgi:hypothetical protein